MRALFASVCGCLSAVFLTVPLWSFTANADTVLTWNGANGAVWDTVSANWLDADSNPAVWTDGATAVFTGAGGIVNVEYGIYQAEKVVFTGTGNSLLGAGYVRTGEIEVSDGVTGVIGACVLTEAGGAKTGSGTLALGVCRGPLTVSSGTLIVAGSGFKDADITVADAAALQLYGAVSTTGNLLLNASFESPAVDAGTYQYCSAGYAFDNWTWVRGHAVVQNTAKATAWNSEGTAKDGDQVLIVQREATVEQTVNVQVAGLYSISLSAFLRKGYSNNYLYVLIDGAMVISEDVRVAEFNEKTYGSPVFWLPAGEHTVRIVGEGGWDDRSTMVDWISLSQSFTGGFLGFERNAILRGAGTIQLLCDGDVAVNQNLSTCTVSGGAITVKETPFSLNATQTSGDWTTGAFWGGTVPLFDSTLQNLNVNGLTGLSSVGAGDENAFPYHTITINGDDTLLATLSGTRMNGIEETANKIVSAFQMNSFGGLTLNTVVSTGANGIIDPLGTIYAESGFSGSGPQKRGPGILSFGADLPANTPVTGSILEGFVRFPFAPSSNFNLYTIYQRTGGVIFAPVASGIVYSNTINLKGTGKDVISLEGAGKSCTISNVMESDTDEVELNVQEANSTLKINQILNRVQGNTTSCVAVVKSGPGTAVILDEAVDGDKTSGNRRGVFSGGAVIRNGTLAIATDDDGVAPGGALGRDLESSLVFGDALTAASDTLTLQARADVTVSRPIFVTNRGLAAGFALAGDASRMILDGPVTLGRSELTFTGNSSGLIGLTELTVADGLGQVSLTSANGPRIALDAMSHTTVTVVAPNGFSAGVSSPATVTLAGLESGFLATFFFNATENSQVHAGDLALGFQQVELKTEGGSDFAEAGTYTLYTYTGTFTGDVSTWAVANPSDSKRYTFAHDAANKRITLVIEVKAGATDYTWANTGSGNWGIGSNWDVQSAPNGTGLKAIFGLKITDDATVTLEDDKTIGSLFFNNTKSYTLSGQILTFSDPDPAITIDSGSHTINSPIAGDAFRVNANEGASLTLNNTVNQSVTVETGSLVLGKDADLKGNLTVKSDANLSLAGDSAKVSNLTVESGATVRPNGGTLTVETVSDSSLPSGALTGSGTLVKSGLSTLTVDGIKTFTGTADIQSGTLALKESQFNLNATIAEGATLTAGASEMTGLMGYYYAVDASTLGSKWTNLSTLEDYLATLTVDDIIPTSAHLSDGTFNMNKDNWPAPYKPGSSRADYFVAVWRGVLTIPVDGLWELAVAWDDAFLLAIDGKELLTGTSNTANVFKRASRFLAKGDHDIVISLMEVTGDCYCPIRISGPGQQAILLPLAWLRPTLAAKRISGEGTLALDSGAGLHLDPMANNGRDGYDDAIGALTLGTGSYFAQLGSLLTIGTANLGASSGLAAVRNGDLFINGGGGSSTARLMAGATSVLALNGDWISGGVSGEGTVSIDGGAYAMEFTGDADCGISADKTYTHAVDLPNDSKNSKLPVINGVHFTMTGNYSGFPTSAWNNNSGGIDGNQGNDANANLSPMDSFLWDFCYNLGAMDAKIGGLTPGQLYDFRLYYKNFGNNQRWFTMTFMVEGQAVGTVRWNPDGHKRSIIGCRYRAGASGELHIVVSDTMADTPHYYGFTNEALPDEDIPAHTLTLAPAEGETPTLTGAIVGEGVVTVNGEGTQVLGGRVAAAGGLTVENGTVELLPGATLQTGVTIGFNGTLAANPGNVTINGLAGEGTLALTGQISFHYVTGDADSGISSSKTYTHAFDCGSGTVATVNGVAFTQVTGANAANYSNGPGSGHAGGNVGYISIPTDQKIYEIYRDMCYNKQDVSPTVFSGLTPGKSYDLRIYIRRWNDDGLINQNRDRPVEFIFDTDDDESNDDHVTIGVDRFDPAYLSYRYIALTDHINVTFHSLNNSDTLHLYGVTNEEIDDETVMVNCEEDSTFNGKLTGCGAWAKTGSGALTVTGFSTAKGPVTVAEGMFGVAEDGTATLGDVTVKSGASVFGTGTLGGSIAVEAGGAIAGGTGNGGTLTAVNGITIAAEGIVEVRHGATGGGTIHAGSVTLPASGNVAYVAVGADQPPARVTLFTSDNPISGPDTFDAWSITQNGAPVPSASLSYSADKRAVYLLNTFGTVIFFR